MRACPRDRLLPFPGTLNPARLCQRVLLRAAGVLKRSSGADRLVLLTASLYVGSRATEVKGKSQWLASKRGGLCVPLLAACSSGLVALAVTVFHAVSEFGFLVALACTVVVLSGCLVQAPNCCFGNSFLGAVCGGTGVCSDTWLFLPDLVEVRDVGVCVVRLWSHVVAPVFCVFLCLGGCVPRVASALCLTPLVLRESCLARPWLRVVAFLSSCSLAGVHCWTVVVAAYSPCVASSVSCERECSLYREFSMAFLQVLEVASFPTRSECVAVVAGCTCFERGFWFARAAFGFVVCLRISVGVSRRLREPACGVAFTGAGLWSMEPVEGVLTLLAVPLLLGCVLLAVCLALRACAPLGTVLCSVDVVAQAKQMLCVLSEFFSVGSGGGLRYAAIVLVVAFWWVFPEHRLGGSVGERLLALWVEVLPKLPCCLSVRLHVSQLRWWDFVGPRSREVCFISRTLRALPDGSLEEAYCVPSSSAFRGLLGVVVLPHGIWCRVTHRGDLCGKGPSPCAVLRLSWSLPSCALFPCGTIAVLGVFLVGLVCAAPMELSTSACVLYIVVVHPVSCRMSGLALPLWQGQGGDHREVVTEVPVATVIHVATAFGVAFLSRPDNGSRLLFAFWSSDACHSGRCGRLTCRVVAAPREGAFWSRPLLSLLRRLELVTERWRLVQSESGTLVGTPRCSISTVGLPADVATTERVATSEKASPRSDANLSQEVVGKSEQLASKRGGLCVPLLAACGGGLVALAVTVFHAIFEFGFLVALALTVVVAPNCYFGNPFLGAVLGGTGVCSSLTSWSARGARWFCLWDLDFVEV
ncbi:hypothetical protein Taro_000551 [Colocasia esculenta]|uniref:Uncharacterized protein n=1 Tax=Colocasia esculenta TaxID=4460 RepID=A0A843TFG1_COLES|nr:hypothetical protein [Colocasia esculenta]